MTGTCRQCSNHLGRIYNNATTGSCIRCGRPIASTTPADDSDDGLGFAETAAIATFVAEAVSAASVDVPSFDPSPSETPSSDFSSGGGEFGGGGASGDY